MNKDIEVQKILKSKYMEGPKFKMSDEAIGINYFSGSNHSVFYELYGPSTVYKLIIIKPSDDLFTSTYVGKGHLLFFIFEENRMVGGFVSLAKQIDAEFRKVFAHLDEEQIIELTILWNDFVLEHYSSVCMT